jgi:hypothetical protein
VIGTSTQNQEKLKLRFIFPPVSSATFVALSLLLTILCSVQTLAGEEKMKLFMMNKLAQHNSNVKLNPRHMGMGV